MENEQIMNDDKIFVTTDDGQEKEMTILFTFDAEEYGKQYVLFYDDNSSNDEVFAMSYDDQGNLLPIEDDQEWEMVNEMLEVYNNEQDEQQD